MTCRSDNKVVMRRTKDIFHENRQYDLIKETEKNKRIINIRHYNYEY